MRASIGSTPAKWSCPIFKKFTEETQTPLPAPGGGEAGEPRTVFRTPHLMSVTAGAFLGGYTSLAVRGAGATPRQLLGRIRGRS